MTDRLTLVTAATGGVGSLLVDALRDGGHPVRATDDLDDAAALATAMDGVDTVALITRVVPDAAERAKRAIDAAVEAGVRRVVRLSVIRPDDRRPADDVRQHARTEDDLAAAPVAGTVVRPSFFMQNLLMSARSIAEEGHMRWPMGEARVSMIDARDVADALARVITDPEGHDGAVHTLTGPAAISFAEVAEALQAAVGAPVTYTAISPEAVEQALAQMGFGDWFAAAMRDYSRAYADGWGELVTDDLEQLVGRAPRSIEDFAREVFAPALATP